MKDSPDHPIDGHRHDDHGGHRRHHRGREGKRPFDYGEMRLLLLAMIVERPSHGYDLMKSIEDRMGGRYSPSPGVIYPTLAWLEDMGYAAVDTEQPGRKRYRITAEGEAFLLANNASVDALLTRTAGARPDGAGPVPATVIRAMENVKLALRLRLRAPVDARAAEAIANALDAAAQVVERS